MPVLRPIIVALMLTMAVSSRAAADTSTIRIQAPLDTRVSYAVIIPVIGETPAIVTVQAKPSRRHQRTRRALFQTWTGFRKQYSGRRYPF